MMVESRVGRDPDLEERLPPPEAAEEAKRLIAAFKDILPKNREKGRDHQLYTHPPYRVELEQLPNAESLRASRQLPNIVQSVILVSGEGAGGFHFIETINLGYPETYGHNATAIRKIEEFMVGFREALNTS